MRLGCLLALSLGAASACHGANELLRFDDPTAPGAAGLFGFSSALENDVLVVGAPNALSGTAVGGGLAHVFDFGQSPPALRFTLAAPDAQNFAEFGDAVDTDGTTIVVGAQNFNGTEADSGKAYLFNAADGSFIRSITPAVEAFRGDYGRTVEVQGDRVLVGAPRAPRPDGAFGEVEMRSVSTGALLQTFAPNDPGAYLFGIQIELVGDVVVIGASTDQEAATSAGAVFLYDRDSGVQLNKIFASDARNRGAFGKSIDALGTLLAVGGSNRAYLIDIADPMNPIERAKLMDPDDGSSSFGSDVAIDGDRLLVGKPLDDFAFEASGGACLFDISDPTMPELIAELTQSDATENDRLGFSLDMNADKLAIFAYTANSTGPNDGAGYVFANAPDPFCAGDVNSDGETNTFDFAELADNFGDGPGATLGQGDLNGDGFVDIFDFAILAEDFGCSTQ